MPTVIHLTSEVEVKAKNVFATRILAYVWLFFVRGWVAVDVAHSCIRQRHLSHIHTQSQLQKDTHDLCARAHTHTHTHTITKRHDDFRAKM